MKKIASLTLLSALAITSITSAASAEQIQPREISSTSSVSQEIIAPAKTEYIDVWNLRVGDRFDLPDPDRFTYNTNSGNIKINHRTGRVTIKSVGDGTARIGVYENRSLEYVYILHIKE
ncbi:hypothetical protein [Paenibacillus tyrfis]|uniref:hypothetical protein n=1 Tax=Paenibacillus tyrfis TaxID=1501230 RepID=UPI00209E5FDE|nr:hypothetical protein [Paenibacillus tyrfis]MCP1306466.1 hypothetical protein [Paenibacillus tyrfis]